MTPCCLESRGGGVVTSAAAVSSFFSLSPSLDSFQSLNIHHTTVLSVSLSLCVCVCVSLSVSL